MASSPTSTTSPSTSISPSQQYGIIFAELTAQQKPSQQSPQQPQQTETQNKRNFIY